MVRIATRSTSGSVAFGRLRRPLVALLGAIAAVLAALVLLPALPTTLPQAWTFRPWLLAGATLLELATVAWTVHLWSRILAFFEGPRPGYRNLLRAWRASTLARYLPGSVWSAASTVEMAGRIGASAVALPSSFLLLAALNLAGALTVAALVGSTSGSHRGGLPPLLAAGAFAGALVLVHPRVVSVLVGAGARLARRPAPAWRGSWLHGAMLVLLFIGTWLAYGAAFSLFLSALVPTAGTSWLRLAGMNALAFSAGFVAFVAPGGVGVREAALVALLSPMVAGTSARVALAATSRAWLLLTEAIGVALVVASTRSAPRGARTAPASRRRTSRAARATGVAQPSTGATTYAGMQVALLTDTRQALADITNACAAATHSIWISQLAFDADCVAAATPGAPAPRTLLETIVGAARARSAAGTPLDVRIVLNGGLLLDTAPALRRAISALGAGPNVRVRTVKAFPQVMHAKAIVIDGTDAFITGASLVNGYWDDARHAPAGASDAGAGTGARPLHDAAVRLRGPAVGALSEWFAELWRSAAPGEKEESSLAFRPPPRAGVAGAGTVQVLRTTPSSRRSAGRREILDAYLQAIDGARSFIYLESQYFSARPIARAVRAALDARPSLELIVVVNQNPDVTAYRGWQDARFSEYGLLDHPRAGVFALWSAVPSLAAPARMELTQVFVHGKVAIIDDAWATLGTANLDGASLHSYGDDFASALGRRVFGRYRNHDINVALLDGSDGAPRTGVAAELRQRLWARHLGMPTPALAVRPAGGWLPTWRSCATTNVARLASGARPAPMGLALPYVPRAHPRDQLSALGIDVASAGLELRFDPSWLEVHCSPGWMAKLVPESVRRWRPWG